MVVQQHPKRIIEHDTGVFDRRDRRVLEHEDGPALRHRTRGEQGLAVRAGPVDRDPPAPVNAVLERILSRAQDDVQLSVAGLDRRMPVLLNVASAEIVASMSTAPGTAICLPASVERIEPSETPRAAAPALIDTRSRIRPSGTQSKSSALNRIEPLPSPIGGSGPDTSSELSGCRPNEKQVIGFLPVQSCVQFGLL